jgi:hypothetical protein
MGGENIRKANKTACSSAPKCRLVGGGAIRSEANRRLWCNVLRCHGMLKLFLYEWEQGKGGIISASSSASSEQYCHLR